jgi:hypothetical protein
MVTLVTLVTLDFALIPVGVAYTHQLLLATQEADARRTLDYYLLFLASAASALKPFPNGGLGHRRTLRTLRTLKTLLILVNARDAKPLLSLAEYFYENRIIYKKT